MPYAAAPTRGHASPNDDCQYATWPPDNGLSLLPGLLRTDRGVNCAVCPECDDPPLECYECDQAGEIVGGKITILPDEQPEPGDTVCFEWEPFTVEGRMRKCKADCGSEGTECPIEMTVGWTDWVIEKKNPDTGAWEVVKSSANGDQPCITGANCEEYRFRLTSASVPATENCDELAPVDNIKEVQFAEFTYTLECYADGRSSARVGVREIVNIELVPEGTIGVWRKISGGGTITRRDGGRRADFRAPNVRGTTVIEVESGGCKRRIEFSIVEPSGLSATRWTLDFHEAGEASAGLTWYGQVLPTDVSFRYIWITEGTTTWSASDGMSRDDGMHHPSWTSDVGCGNFMEKIDGSFSGSFPPTGTDPLYAAGESFIETPWYWRAAPNGGLSYRAFTTTVATSALSVDGTMTHTKIGLTVTFPFGPPAAGAFPWAGATSPAFLEPADDYTHCP